MWFIVHIAEYKMKYLNYKANEIDLCKRKRNIKEDKTLIEIRTNEATNAARIIVVGVGGAGNNAVNRMIDENITGIKADDYNNAFYKTSKNH